MADGDIDVTYQDMHDAADYLVEAKDEILVKLQTLRTYISDLVRDGYVTSASSSAFDQSYDEFNTGARDAVEALQGMADFLDGAADGYADLDQQLEEGLRE
ncbi:WXG100 family type VII secretion target [Streptomyces sp. DSM 44915]|uniref:WXG100 family type VII secretion target n=1 Tax=Streptomyces chisholmiae TaxID=3075540 RepID=A0ABU2JK83_9ACTN|nr:WXG100 family type VII secretion target [Streptomyces sp. DSM 44915]MDT0265385.1 WXG100 family type VII secretion target [Streptomyces sp. DSM 44915]